MRTYDGVNLWAEGVRRPARIDRMKVIEALESGISFDGPPGMTTLDPKTHHATARRLHRRGEEQGLPGAARPSRNQPPSDTQSVCDLQKEPNANKQVVVDIKT